MSLSIPWSGMQACDSAFFFSLLVLENCRLVMTWQQPSVQLSEGAHGRAWPMAGAGWADRCTREDGRRLDGQLL